MQERSATTRQVIEDEEKFVRLLKSDPMRYVIAGALRRAGVRDEAQMVANALSTRDDSVELPLMMADGVIAYLATAIEAGTAVRRASLEAKQ